MKSETTFKETYKFLQTHGWKRITLAQYCLEKREKKFQTARIGIRGYFKLRKSNYLIMEELKPNIFKDKELKSSKEIKG